MKLVVLAALMVVVTSEPLNEEESSKRFEQFKIDHGKKYESVEEEEIRKAYFVENLKAVDEHNMKYIRGEETYKVGINQFSDLPMKKVGSELHGCYRKSRNLKDQVVTYLRANVSVPKEVDWRKKGAVTPVKNQGQCGSCWAFSTTGVLEGAHFLKTGKLVSLSEQNLVDCDKVDDGCGSGDVLTALEFIHKNGGIDTESSYPYIAKERKCHFRRRNVGATVKGYHQVPRGDEEQLKIAVATVGPVSVGVDARSRYFMHYTGSDVFKLENCRKTNLDHSVLVVGYGTTEKGEDYWLIKNSWGVKWGMNGYMLLARNHNNMCGVASEAVYPVV